MRPALVMLGVATAVILTVTMLPVASDKKSDTPISLDHEAWVAFSERFIEKGRVIDRQQGGISHSEGQGYGMLMAVAAGDRQHFDRLWAWSQNVLQRKDGLFSWRYEPCPNEDASCVTDYNNASDGDVLIAWALLRAHQRWHDNSYYRHSSRIAEAIANRLVKSQQGRVVLLPGIEGFVDEEVITLNPSYWIFPALEAFSDEFDEPVWEELAASGRWLLQQGRFGVHQLPADWVKLEDGAIRISEKSPPRYSYNAVRIPLHLAWSEHGISAVELIPYESLWSAESLPPAWINLVDGSTSEFSWNTGMEAIAAFARYRAEHQTDDLELPLPDEDEGYYSWSLTLLTHIAARETAR